MREITAAEAAELLSATPDYQRKIMRRSVEDWKAQMEDGKWADYATMVILDTDGKVLDGQHRLQAQVETGMSQKYVVQYEAPVDLFEVVDCGAKRRMADRAQTSTRISTIASAYATYQSNAPIKACLVGHKSGGLVYATDIDVIEAVKEHTDLFEKIDAYYVMVRKMAKRLSTKAFAMFYLTMMDRYEEREVSEFCKELGNWLTTCPQAIAAIKSLSIDKRTAFDQYSILVKSFKYYHSGFEPNMPTKIGLPQATLDSLRKGGGLDAD